ncbi:MULTISPECIES: Holliday junction resolvase RuvX [Sphingobacterium]|uniref:Putative pre-16S rRNA nuclease n=1 Tax=Sphingobacterium detergens TaxID=1145106 RepID=A0A420AYU5_SPHD1|nr:MULTISPECIES: Holliday junction resolvase RuvX [Sphingobacterium]MCS4224859.1 putative Holliday junction resolvase [Sphingobacterium sp. BIGb0165]RKE49573.1 putative Holliday junction resolvase [Sphingobacterium detergens]
MRLMAFDYGTKRIGVAVTDPMQIIATALTTVHPQDIWTFLTDYLQTEQIETFVVGKPKQLDGSDSESASHVVGFMRKLKKTYPTIPVVEIDERFTSKMASAAIAQSGKKKKDRQQKGLVDTVSATIILQSYMEGRNF